MIHINETIAIREKQRKINSHVHTKLLIISPAINSSLLICKNIKA